MWIALLLLNYVFGTAGYLLRRKLAKDFPEHIPLMNSVFFICFLLPVGIVFALILPHDLNVGWTNLWYLLAGSIIWPGLNLISFYANKHTDVGIFTVISNISPLFTLAIALPFLGESFGAVQFAGIILLIFSGLIAASTQMDRQTPAKLHGIMLCFVSAIILGCAVAYERFMLSQVDLGAYVIYGWGAQIVWATLMARKDLGKIPSLFRKGSPTRNLLLAWGSTSVLKSVTFVSALKMSTASVMSAASNFMSVAVVIAAYFFLKERSHLTYKLIAAGVGIVGLFLITQ